MTKAMNLLQKLGIFRVKEAQAPSAFDLRLQAMGGVHKVSVARAVLFRTGLSH
ncbi:hypothetical protein MASR1M32_41350 [Rhodobacter sp.]